MDIGNKVTHKLTGETFLLVGTISYSRYYTPDAYICVNTDYERHEFREWEIETTVEPEKESIDTNG